MTKINVEDIKKYNAALKQQKDRANKLIAQRDYKKAEMEKACRELSEELGIDVTPHNVKDILEERKRKIENAVKTGNEILQRIQDEEARIISGEVIEDVGSLDESAFGDVSILGDLTPPPSVDVLEL